jgi:hypothetical protein
LESRDIADQAGQDDCDWCEESAPVAVGAASVHAATVRAAPALDPQWLAQAVEIASDVAMAPEPLTTAERTPPRPRPGVELAKT